MEKIVLLLKDLFDSASFVELEGRVNHLPHHLLFLGERGPSLLRFLPRFVLLVALDRYLRERGPALQ